MVIESLEMKINELFTDAESHFSSEPMDHEKFLESHLARYWALIDKYGIEPVRIAFYSLMHGKSNFDPITGTVTIAGAIPAWVCFIMARISWGGMPRRFNSAKILLTRHPLFIDRPNMFSIFKGRTMSEGFKGRGIVRGHKAIGTLWNIYRWAPSKFVQVAQSQNFTQQEIDAFLTLMRSDSDSQEESKFDVWNTTWAMYPAGLSMLWGKWLSPGSGNAPRKFNHLKAGPVRFPLMLDRPNVASMISGTQLAKTTDKTFAVVRGQPILHHLWALFSDDPAGFQANASKIYTNGEIDAFKTLISSTWHKPLIGRARRD